LVGNSTARRAEKRKKPRRRLIGVRIRKMRNAGRTTQHWEREKGTMPKKTALPVAELEGGGELHHTSYFRTSRAECDIPERGRPVSRKKGVLH